MNVSRKTRLIPYITRDLTPCSSFARKARIMLKISALALPVRLSPLFSTSASFAHRRQAKALQMLLNHVSDCVLRRCAPHFFFDLTALEQKQRGNAADAVADGHGLVLIHVKLAHLGALTILGRDGLNCRRHHPARAAPFRPKVY